MTEHDLKEFLRSELNLKELQDDAQMGRTRGWDSLKQVNLMLTLDQVWSVSVPPDRFGELTSYQALKAFLTDEGVLN